MMHESNRLICVGVITTHICETGEAVGRKAFPTGDSRLGGETRTNLGARKACSLILVLPLLLATLEKVS